MNLTKRGNKMSLKEHYGINKMIDLIPTEWEDTSWGNDAMYSYEFGSVRIWIDVEVENISMSEFSYDLPVEEFKRFFVSTSDTYREENPDDHYNDSWLLETNNWIDVVSFVKENHNN